MSDSPLVYVHLLPNLIPAGSLRGGVAVVLDVLRATSVMVQALDSGAESIRPCLEIADAQALAAELPAGSAVLAGERLGLPIEGFDFGNSPGAFTRESVGGKTVVMTTTNGTKAILAALDAEVVYIAAFLNLASTVRRLRAEKRPVHLVGSGTNGLVSWEDSLLAGAIVQGLAGTHAPIGNDEALLTAAAWNGRGDTDPYAVLARGYGGRRVTEIGLTPDIKRVAEVDTIDLVARVERDPTRIVRAD